MIFEKSAFELAEAIKTGEISSQEIVDRHIRKIEEVNPKLNAVVETRFAEAMELAKRADEKIASLDSAARETLPSLFGVPFTIKEMIAVQGMKSTWGSIHRKNQIMRQDATVTSRLRNAGGILLGTTNVPEVGFWFECHNLVYGKTKNPFNLKRTSGGSSGGEGAIIASGGSPFGVGSDIGGSIRIPAAFCGVFGHKPSEGLIPFTGHVPVYEDTAHEMIGNKHPFTVLGPMSKKAKDLRLLMQILIGGDNMDREVKDYQLPMPPSDFRELRVFTIAAPVMQGLSSTDQDLSQAVKNAGRYLQELGTTLTELPERLLLKAFEMWTTRAWTIEGRDFALYLSNDEGIQFKNEFLKMPFKKSKYTLPTLLTAFLNSFPSAKANQQKNLQALTDLKIHLTEILQDNGVLILPVHPRKAPKHGMTVLRPFDFAMTGIFNALGFPATSVPMGLSKDGLPLSVQVVAAENKDHLCLAVAEALEAGFGGWVMPK